MFSESEWMYKRQKLYELWHEHIEWSLGSWARAVQHDLRWVRKWVKWFEAWGDHTKPCFAASPANPSIGRSAWASQ